jgi:hypothetical protein
MNGLVRNEPVRSVVMYLEASKLLLLQHFCNQQSGHYVARYTGTATDYIPNLWN